MNREIRVYTELDSLYDTRRGILELLLLDHLDKEVITPPDKRKLVANKLWDSKLDSNYKERRMDTFSYKEFGINREVFLARYEKRNLSDWEHFYPSNVADRLVKIIMDVELMEEKPIDIKGITLMVNTYPYAFDEELNEQLKGYLQTALNNIVKVELMSFDVSNQTIEYYRKFNYVFKYDLFLSEKNKAFQESLDGKIPSPELRLVVPDILIKDLDIFTGPISDRMELLTVTLAPMVTILPVKHEVYDYREW